MVSPMKRLCLLLVCALLGVVSSEAQRLLSRQRGVELVLSVPSLRGEPLTRSQLSMGVALTQNLKRAHYGFLSAEYGTPSLPYRGYSVPLSSTLLQAGYMHAILSDRGKNVLAYLGISALGGYEAVRKKGLSAPEEVLPLKRSLFVYGGAVHSAIECFLSDRLLLVLRAQGRVLLGTELKRFRPALSVGLRVNL